jgi:hypothetical protein
VPRVNITPAPARSDRTLPCTPIDNASPRSLSLTVARPHDGLSDVA